MHKDSFKFKEALLTFMLMQLRHRPTSSDEYSDYKGKFDILGGMSLVKDRYSSHVWHEEQLPEYLLVAVTE